jgi:A/G-specific adenine glycosylase
MKKLPHGPCTTHKAQESERVASAYLAKLERFRSRRYHSEVTQIRAFQRLVLGYYAQSARDFAWRRTRDPYRILVSEIMLQQTQTSRVEQRYPLFLKRFPTLESLATASQSEVIRQWQGLGYYRRARNLHRAAIAICAEHQGRFPKTSAALRELPGVGDYTAAAVATFAFGEVVPMVETNIRSVYLYAFFSDKSGVADTVIVPYIRKTIVKTRAREWFYALMDLGVELKRARPRINHASKHHTTQSPFEGSRRQVAAKVLRYVLGSTKEVSILQVTKDLSCDPDLIVQAVERLIKEGMIIRTKSGTLTAHSA